MNSNTKGSQVANIGYWPAGILPRVQAALNSIITSIKGLQAGTLLSAGVDFAQQGDNDKIPDAMLSEIVRRLVVTFENPTPGSVIFSPTAPNDHTKGWWQTDPVTALPVGRLKSWREDIQQWKDVDTAGMVSAPLKRTLTLVSPAGASTVNGNFEDIKTTDYRVILTPTTFQGGAWAPPVAFPGPFGFVIVNKTSNSISAAFYGVPTGGLVWEVDLEARA